MIKAIRRKWQTTQEWLLKNVAPHVEKLAGDYPKSFSRRSFKDLVEELGKSQYTPGVFNPDHITVINDCLRGGAVESFTGDSLATCTDFERQQILDWYNNSKS